jgi:hypothetical protein
MSTTVRPGGNAPPCTPGQLQMVALFEYGVTLPIRGDE